jgi:hypothetical protein
MSEAVANNGGGGQQFGTTSSNFRADMARQDSAASQQPQVPNAGRSMQTPANDNGALQNDPSGNPLADQILADDDGAIPEVEQAQEAYDETEEQPAADPLDEVMFDDGNGKTLKMRDVLESLKNGVVPAELHDKIQLEVDVNGQPRVMSVSELRKGYLREADYTKKAQQVAELRRENEQWTAEFNRRMQMANDDPSGREFQKQMRRMGMGQAFFRAAQQLSVEMDRILKLPPHEQEREWKLKQLEEERAELLERQAMNEESEQAKRKRQAKERLDRTLAEFTPIAFERAGKLARTPYNERVFRANLAALREHPGQEITLDLCTRAAVATMEQLGDEARENQQAIQARLRAAGGSPAQQQMAAAQQAQQQPQQRRLPVRPAAAGAPLGGGSGQQGATRGGSARDFHKTFLKR